jgi:sugar phosphate permease
MPLLAQWLISAYSWQDAFKVMAGIMILVGTPVSIVIMRTRPEDKGLLPDGKSSLEETAHEENESVSKIAAVDFSLREVVKTSSFWLLSLAGILWCWAYDSALVHQVAFAKSIGIPEMAAA